HVRRDASFECQAVPQDLFQAAAMGIRAVLCSYGKAQRGCEAGSTTAFRLLPPLRFVVVVHQPVAALRKTVLRNAGADLVDPRAEERRPIERLHAVQSSYDVVERIGNGDIAPVVNPEEELRKIIKRLLAIAQLA